MTAGDATLIEGDDSVQFMDGITPPVPFTLAPAEELRVSVWWLEDGEGNILQVADGKASESVFLSGFDEAGLLRDYLRNANDPSTIASRSLYLNGAPLTKAGAASLQVRIHKMNW